MSNYRPSEVKIVREYLENGIALPRKDGEDEEKYRNRLLDTGAYSIIKAIDASREDRTDYLVVRQVGVMADAYGPYATYDAAQKAIEESKIPAIDGSRFFVIPLRHPSHAEAAWAKADDGGVGEQARKMWQIARNGGMPARQSTRRRRRPA